MSGSISIWPQIPGFSGAVSANPSAPAPMPQGVAPAVAPEIRAKMTEALYQDVYAKALPRDEFDKRMTGLSDVQIADAAYKTFYEGKVDRAKFNETVGLSSPEGSTATAIQRGMSGGFLDEATAGAMTGIRTLGTALSGNMPTLDGITGAYNQELQGQRDATNVFRQNNPYVAPALEIGGGVLTGGAGAGTTMTAAPTAAQTALNAAKVGAVTGFGEAEGGAANRVEGAGVGGLLGGAIGAAAPAVMSGVSMALGRIGKVLGLGDSEKVASQLLLKAFQDDGIPPQQIGPKLQAWRDAGAKPEALFDLGGENVKRLARAAAGRTGPGTERAVTFIEGRQADQAQRVGQDVATTLGQRSDDFHPTLTALNTERKTTAAPLYREAFQTTPTADEVAPVQRFIRDPIGQDALQKGMRVIELEHLAAGEPFKPAMYGVTRGQDGRWVLAGDEVPNLRLMDAVKRGYDQIVEGFRNPVTGRLELDQYGRAVNDVRATYTGALRDTFPRYGDALNAWSGPSQMMDAANRGRSIFTMRDSEIAAAAVAARNNPAEADAFRLGVSQAVRDQIARAPDGADAAKRIFGSPQKRELLRAAFPNEAAFLRFEALMKREAAMFENAKFVSSRTGSQTHMRGSDAEGLGNMAADAVGALALGAVVPGQSTRSAVGQIATNLAARGQGMTAPVADALAARLFTSNPQSINATAGLLSQAEINNALARVGARRMGGLLLPGFAGGVNVAR